MSSVEQYASEFSYKIINDPIYGCISLSRTEVQLLDTRAMQRLRRIRQMGFASYVFPSGEHSRFVHSLGVLCIMGKMCEHLYRQYGNAEEGFSQFSINDARKARIAALLHDIGHFPFSHLSECVYSFIDTMKTTNDMVEGLNSPVDDTKQLLSDIANFRKRKEKDHEHLGAEVIKRDPEIAAILLAANITPEEIGKIIIGDTQANPVYAQLLHSSLDADRLDYLLRDSRQAGVSFGNVELEYILRQMRIERCPIHRANGTEEKIDLVVFDARGQHAIEHFLMARYFHYTQVVQHKTSSAFEAVAKALEYRVLTTTDTPYKSYDDIVSLIGTDTFYLYTDDYLWQTICSNCEESNDPYIRALWECLQQRKKPTHVLTLTDIVPKIAANPKASPVNDSVYLLAKWLIQNMQCELAAESGIDSAYIGFVESKVYLESIPSHLRAEDCSLDNFPDDVRGAIRIIDKEGNISFLASDSKSLINKMVDYTSNTLNIFVVGDVDCEKIAHFNKVIIQKARKR
ncbi:MAG: HD domain-containing protein [Eubacteriaceae bacterium]